MEKKKRPSALSKAKAEIVDLKKELKAAVDAANVRLNDNIVTDRELKWLRIYKGFFIASLCIFTVALLTWIF